MNRRSPLFIVSAILLPASAALYFLSLTMNVALVQTKIQVMTFSQSSEDTVKLLSTIKTLWQEKDYVLVALITAFTIIFPVGKYVALGWVMSTRNEITRSRVLGWIKNLGQWSMGDVFVVALLVVMLRINSSVGQLNVEPQAGLYVFTASVLTSMFVSVFLAFEIDRSKK